MKYQKTIEFFLLDGDANDRIICKVSNWDGLCYKIPKSKIKESKDRTDLQNTGIYMLLGKIDDQKAIYIGEAENIYSRLEQHLIGKDFWNDSIVFVKKDNSLNKAHIKYIENSLYTMAKEADRFLIENSTIPSKSSITEFEIAAMNEYVDYIKMLTNILGYKVFDKIVDENKIDKENIYYINSKNLKAKGMLTNEGFVVFKDSQSDISFKKASSNSLKVKWEYLKENNIIDKDNVFTKDYLFSSPSLAAAMVLCRNANGLTEWKDENKKTLKSKLETSERK